MTDERIETAAAVGFDRVAADYDGHRPGYPQALIDRLAAELGIGPGRRVLDLAAGTGKFTRMLIALGADVVAVEPTPGMRAECIASTPGLEVLDGTAEAIPLPDASVDVVTAAQAFHWFDTDRALDEIARVLRPGGGLGLVWNTRGRRGGWMDEFEQRADSLAGGKARYRGDGWEQILDRDTRFSPRQNASVEVDEHTTSTWLVESLATRSWIASKSESDRATILAGMRDFLATHPDTAGREELVHTHPCVIHWCRVA